MMYRYLFNMPYGKWVYKVNFILSLIALILTNIQLVNAQDEYPYPSLSPKSLITQVVGNTQIQIEYERPSVRERKIFGALVPWHQVWRTGAGHCTRIRFSNPVNIEGHQMDAGSYSIFTIPNPKEWIIIFNRDTTLYGSSWYNSDKDALRIKVQPEKSARFYESLNFDIEIIPNNARIFISWENTQINFNIETTTDKEIEAFIESELLSGKSRNSNIYAGAAEYYLYQNTQLSRATSLAEKALQIDPDNGWARDLKIRIYLKQALFTKALLEVERAILTLKKSDFQDKNERERALEQLDKQKIEIMALFQCAKN